jgi:hypothetical protein
LAGIDARFAAEPDSKISQQYSLSPTAKNRPKATDNPRQKGGRARPAS